MVKVELPEELEAIWTCAGFRLHVGASAALPVPAKLIMHVRFTAPAKPPDGATWMVSVAPPPGALMVKEVDAEDTVTDEPVPVSETVCGEPLALSVIVRVPVSEPATVGVDVTEAVQFPPAARLEPQVFVAAKLLDALMDVIVAATALLLVSVTVWAALVEPTFCAAKERPVGATVTTGVATVTDATPVAAL
jgi:hypothetical protein